MSHGPIMWGNCLLLAAVVLSVACATCPSGFPAVVSFSGSTRATLTPFDVGSTSAVLVNLWMRVTDNAGTRGVFVYGHGNFPTDVRLLVDIGSAKYSGSIKDASFAVGGTGKFTDGSWHQVTLAWVGSSSSVRVWEDQTLIGSASASSHNLGSPGCFVVGQIPTAGCGNTGFTSFQSDGGLNGQVSQVPQSAAQLS